MPTFPAAMSGDQPRPTLGQRVTEPRVLIVGDQPNLRDGIAFVLQACGMDVVGQVHYGADALVSAHALQPDIVLMDIGMPGVQGSAAIRELMAEIPRLKVIVVVASDDDCGIFAAIKSGVAGYILQDTEGDEVCALLTGVIQGSPRLSQRVAMMILEEFEGGRQESWESASFVATARAGEGSSGIE